MTTPKTLDHLIDEFRRLYEVERLTTYEIAAIYNTNRTRITKTLKRHGVIIRTTYQSRWGVNREDRVPSKEQLQKHIDDGMTYLEIANIYSCDKTAVPYWIKRYGIEWSCTGTSRLLKKRGFVEPTLQELFVMYCVDFLNTDEIARKFNCSRGLIAARLKECGIELRPSGWNGKTFKCLDGQIVKSTYEQRVGNWLYEHGIPYEYEPQLPFDRTRKADFLAQGKYIEIWGVRDNETYRARTEFKTAQYNLHGLPLIELGYWHFCAQKRDAWQKRLAKAFISHS